MLVGGRSLTPPGRVQLNARLSSKSRLSNEIFVPFPNWSYQIRNSKSEARNKPEYRNSRKSLLHSSVEVRICFEFRVSNFEFRASDLRKLPSAVISCGP